MLPSHVSAITGNIFKSSPLKEIKLKEPCENYEVVDGVLFGTSESAPGSGTELKGGYMLQAYPCGKAGEYTIPKTVDGKNVRETWPGAMEGAEKLTGVTIPNTLEKLGSSTFARSGLVDVCIPATVATVEGNMFSGCKNLRSAEINATMQSTGFSMFENCKSLTDVKFPPGLEEIDMYAFKNCESLTHLDLPDGVNSMSYHVVDGCKSLLRVVIPRDFNMSRRSRGCWRRRNGGETCRRRC